jgi:hypothetical protein
VIAYNSATVGMAGAFGYFAQLVASSHGIKLPWEVWAFAAIALMGILGYRQIDVSARVLSVLMVAEVSILALLDIAIVIRRGSAALPTTSFNPHTVPSTGIGISLMFALISFVGFESAALYSEEARRPERSVPLATYCAVILIAAFYTLTSWTAVGVIGPAQLHRVAGQQLGNLFFGLSGSYLGSVAATVMQVLLCTSLFAGLLAMHSASNRYMFVLGRDSVLPRPLSAVHARYGSPYRASLVQTACATAVTAAFAIAGLNPYINLATTMFGVGTLGIVGACRHRLFPQTARWALVANRIGPGPRIRGAGYLRRPAGPELRGAHWHHERGGHLIALVHPGRRTGRNRLCVLDPVTASAPLRGTGYGRDTRHEGGSRSGGCANAETVRDRPEDAWTAVHFGRNGSWCKPLCSLVPCGAPRWPIRFPAPPANLQNAYAIRFGIYAIVLMFPRKHKDRNVSEHETCPPPVRVFSLNDSGPSAAQIVLSEDERAQLERWARRAKTAQYLALRAKIVMACAEPPAIHLDQGHQRRTQVRDPRWTHGSRRLCHRRDPCRSTPASTPRQPLPLIQLRLDVERIGL